MPNDRFISSKESNPLKTESRKELKYLGLGGDTSLGFEKVQIVPIETRPELDKCHPKESSYVEGIKPSSELLVAKDTPTKVE